MKFPVKFHSLLSKIEISGPKFRVFWQLKKTWFIYLNLGKNVRVLITLRFHLKNPYQPTLETLSFNEISELYEQAFTRDIVYTFVPKVHICEHHSRDSVHSFVHT